MVPDLLLGLLHAQDHGGPTGLAGEAQGTAAGIQPALGDGAGLAPSPPPTLNKLVFSRPNPPALPFGTITNTLGASGTGGRCSPGAGVGGMGGQFCCGAGFMPHGKAQPEGKPLGPLLRAGGGRSAPRNSHQANSALISSANELF